MKPLYLRLQAFGPFADQEEIDFTQLGDNPLFLINGTTGSGKSTLLDAMAFALYGDTTGKEREAADMRCQYADDASLTEVEFVFCLGEKTYRILRLPAQERKKSRGDGWTLQAAEAYLYEVLADGSESLLVSKKVTEFNQRIIELMGLNSEQFRQVMVLPQGLFRKLLLADSKEREPILSRLFQTELYKRVEEQIKAQAADVLKQMQQHNQQVKGILQSVNCGGREELAQQLEQASQNLVIEQANKTQAASQLKHIENQYQQAKQRVERFEHYARLRQQQQSHLAQQPQIDLVKRQLQQAQRARVIQPHFTQLQRVINEVRQIEQTIERDQAQLTQAQTSLNLAEQAYQQAHVEAQTLDSLKQQRHQLQSLQPKLNELAQALKQLTQTRQHLAQTEAAYQRAQQQLDALSEQRRQAQAALHHHEQHRLNEADLALALQRQTALMEDYQAWFNLKQKQQQLQTHYAHLNSQLVQSEQQHQHMQATLNQLEYNWHLGQAAILAQTLTPNHPCPVCGSHQHPAPAQWQADIQPVEKADIQQAKAQLEQLYQAWSSWHTQVSNVQIQLDANHEQTLTLSRKLGDATQYAMDDLARQQHALRQQLNACQQQQADIQRLTQQLQTLEQQTQAHTTQLKHAENACHVTRTQSELAQHAYQALLQQIPEAYREGAQLQNQLTHLTRQIEQIEQRWQASQKQHEQARIRLSETQHTLSQRQALLDERRQQQQAAQQDWHNQLNQSAFDDEQAFAQALADESDHQAWSYQIETYQQQRAQLEGACQQLEQELQHQSPPDLTALSAQYQQEQHAFAVVETRFNEVHSRLMHLRQVQQTLSDSDVAHQALDADYKIIGTLSEVLSGDNNAKISLQRFVLGVLLDDVLLNATERLRIMTKGRYELVRKDQRSKGAKASGLELEVFDGYTGKSRPVATLSGGESFLAALSLALGLSDVVQSYAGGIKLDTLFIDEGFGSLDPESLELAIDTLKNLQLAGRTIGIISHVQELKEQMPLRIDVMASAQGSSVKVVGRL